MREIVIKEENMRLIQGYASVEVLDRQYDMVPVDTMQRAMLKYVERGAPIMYGHENKPIGKLLSWNVVEQPDYGVPAVEVVASINTGYKLDDEVWNLIKEHKLTGFSIGGTAIKVGEGKMKDGSKARILEEIELSEISVVVEPANQAALITTTSIAKGDEDDKLTPEELDAKAQAVVKQLLFDWNISDSIEKKQGKKHKSYPWKTCVREHSAKLCGYIKNKYGKSVGMTDFDEDFIMRQFIIEKAVDTRPSKYFMEYCVPLAAEKEPDIATSRRVCGYIFYYEFGGSNKESEDWVWRKGKITDDMITRHNIHSYTKYMLTENEAKKALENNNIPDLDWYDKCVLEYEGEAEANLACSYIWQTGGEVDEIPIVDADIKDARKYAPALVKSLEGIAEVMKPFHGFKDWKECMSKIGHGSKMSKKSKQKICGRLKADYEKDNKDHCPNCGSSDIVRGATFDIDGYDEGDYKVGVFKDSTCRNCNTEFRKLVYADEEPEFYLLEKAEKVKELECPYCGEPVELKFAGTESDIIGDNEIAEYNIYTGICTKCGKMLKYYENAKFPDEDYGFEDLEKHVSREGKNKDYRHTGERLSSDEQEEYLRNYRKQRRRDKQKVKEVDSTAKSLKKK